MHTYYLPRAQASETRELYWIMTPDGFTPPRLHTGPYAGPATPQKAQPNGARRWATGNPKGNAKQPPKPPYQLYIPPSSLVGPPRGVTPKIFDTSKLLPISGRRGMANRP